MPRSDDTGAVRRARLALVFGGLALAAVVAVVARLGDAAAWGGLVARAAPAWIAVAVALQAATYACEAGVWAGVLRRGGAGRPFAGLYGLSLVALFTNQVVPTAGVAGTFLVVRALAGRGVPRPVAVSAVLVDLVGYHAAFGVAIAVALAVLRVHHDLSALVLVPAAAVGALGVGLSVGARWLATPGHTPPPWLRRLPGARDVVDALVTADAALVRSGPLLARAFALRALNFAADGLTLWACLRALGASPPPPEAFAAFVIGAIARTLGVVPGGLGTFEGATLGGLALFGVPVEAALAATLLFRGLSFWLPMLPGLWLGRRFARRGAA